MPGTCSTHSQYWRLRVLRPGAGRALGRFALAAACLLVGACGDGSSDGYDTYSSGVIVTASDLGQRFAAYVDTLDGTEFTSPATSGSITAGVDYSYTVLGFAFCKPADLYQAPIVPAPDSQTVYACANGLTASAALDNAAGTLTINLSATALYIDFSGSLNVFGTATGFDGYLSADNPGIQVVYNVIQQSDGNYTLDSLASTPVVTGTWSGGISDPTLNAYASDVIAVVQAYVNAQLGTFAGSQATAYVAQAPEITP